MRVVRRLELGKKIKKMRITFATLTELSNNSLRDYLYVWCYVEYCTGI